MLKKLPLDLSSFDVIREENYFYIDKTQYAYELLNTGRRFFLSRPRRFGKTLFVSMLNELLLGKKELFEGLWVAGSDYHWKPHGVIKLNLSGLAAAESIDKFLIDGLARVAKAYNISTDISNASPRSLLFDLADELKKRFGRVALLIDEYDHPILHNLRDHKRAFEIREGLSQFFAAIKVMDREIDFVFVTGISNFAKAGLFSGLNNICVMSLQDNFAAICGYTQEEVNNYFKDYLNVWAEKSKISLQELQHKIKHWYNGYSFSPQLISVYNPYSLMWAMQKAQFRNFWFESGAPTFLIQEFEKEYRKKEYQLLDLHNLETTESALGIFDIGKTPLPALMYQTGYLTIVGCDPTQDLYKLAYPNFEVRTAMQKQMLMVLAKIDVIAVDQISAHLRTALNNGELEVAIALFKRLFANVPYQLHIKKEKFYHALLQIACDAAGISTQSEYSTSHGRIDLILDLPNWKYIIEIKFNQPAEAGLQQIEDMKYQEAIGQAGKPTILLGLSFHRMPKTFDITYQEKRIAI